MDETHCWGGAGAGPPGPLVRPSNDCQSLLAVALIYLLNRGAPEAFWEELTASLETTCKLVYRTRRESQGPDGSDGPTS